MKIIKFSIFLLVSLLFISFVYTDVNADSGPKPFVIIEISGMEDINYTVTLITKEANGPNNFYNGTPDPLPIMEYIDSDGYRWIGKHWAMHGDGEFNWSYYPPSNFKILIITEDNQYYTTKALERYAFGSYFKINVTEAVGGEVNAVKVINDVKPNYDYFKEILLFILRLILTVAIEIGLAIKFGFKKKRQIITILVVNVITQVFLNATLNITTYFEGQFLAIGFFIIGEFIVFAAESIFYACYFKTERSKAFLYGLLANLLSFLAGFGLYILEQAITISTHF